MVSSQTAIASCQYIHVSIPQCEITWWKNVPSHSILSKLVNEKNMRKQMREK